MPTATADDCDALYRENPDPWNFRESPYERAKYNTTLNLLPGRRYDRVLEVGCSIGVLGRRLAARATRYVGVDASRLALAEARRDALPNMEFLRMTVPHHFPPGRFDLVVLSEILYFLSAPDVARLARRVDAAAPDGDVVLVNWLGPTNRELAGSEAADLFARGFGRPADLVFTPDRFRIDIFGRRP